MKNINLLLVLVSLFFSTLSFQTKAQDSVYYLLDGDTLWFNIQPDVFAVALDSGSALNNIWPKNIVDTIIFDPDSINYVYFADSASLIDIDSVILAIEGMASFQQNFDVVSQVIAKYKAGLFWHTYDVINVLFKEGQVTLTDIDDFVADNNLEVIHSPPSPLAFDEHYHIFKILPVENVYRSSLQVAVDIATNSTIVEHVKPAFSFNGKINSPAPPPPNDTLYAKTWYFKNQALVACGTSASVSGADMNMPRAWNRNNEFGYGTSYNGNGIEIGIIDFYNFQWTHPDLVGRFKPGWNSHVPGGGAAITGDFINNSANPHGTWVSSIAAGNGNNTSGSIGVAYGAKLRPYNVDFRDDRILICLQRALKDSVHVLNMSFGQFDSIYPTQQVAKDLHKDIFDELENCIEDGRGGKGMVVIAAAGNSTIRPSTIWSFPSASNDVLTVGASTSGDKVKIWADGFNNPSTTDWSSDQPPLLGVVAPGTCIWGADLKGSQGAEPGDYVINDGTSASAPLVAGLAALILEKNPLLTYRQVIDIIQNSAEKIGGYNYNVNTNKPGWSKEAGYGRVNAYKALRLHTPPVSTMEYSATTNQLKVMNPVKDNILLWVDEEANYEVQIVNSLGKVVYKNKHQITHEFSLKSNYLAEGIYWLILTNQSNNKVFTNKVVKL